MGSNIVSPETYNRMVAAGWNKPAEETDAQEIANQNMPKVRLENKFGIWSAIYPQWSTTEQLPDLVVEGRTMAEALAKLWLRLHEGKN